jgi:hypothetical protein
MQIWQTIFGQLERLIKKDKIMNDEKLTVVVPQIFKVTSFGVTGLRNVEYVVGVRSDNKGYDLSFEDVNGNFLAEFNAWDYINIVDSVPAGVTAITAVPVPAV